MSSCVLRVSSALLIVQACATLSSPAAAQETQPRVSASWSAAPLRDVLQAFASFSGRSIVAGPGVEGLVTAEIIDQPWDAALAAVLAARGLRAVEEESGILRVERLADVEVREGSEVRQTRVYRLSFAVASEVQPVVASVLSPRGRVAVLQSSNTLVVTDVPRVHEALGRLLGVAGRVRPSRSDAN